MNKSKRKNYKDYDKSSSDSDEAEQTRKNDEPRDYISLRSQHLKKNKVVEQHDGNQVSLLHHYSNQNYFAYIKELRSLIELEKPFYYDNRELRNTICLGANICIYGFGSKQKLLNQIRQENFGNHLVWEVKGYLNTISVKKIYNNFGNFLKKANITDSIKKVVIKDLQEEYRQLLAAYTRTKNYTPIVIIFHCLDSQNLLNVDSQVHLSNLFTLPGVRMVCSIDTIKIAILWPPKVKQAYEFVFFQVNTLVPNIEEQIYQPITTERTELEEQSLNNICESINNNQRKILKILAKNELENMNREVNFHYSVTELLDLCIEQVILSSDVQLRQNLLQILDHKVVHERMDEHRNKKILYLTYGKKLLQKLLDLKTD